MKKIPLTRLPLFVIAILGAAIPVFTTINSVGAAGSPDLTGQWALHNSIAGNESDMDCDFSQEETKVSGSCKGVGQTMKVAGSVDGQKVSWKFNAEYQGDTLTLTYNATVDDPEKISGTVDVQPYDVSGDFTAKRVKAQK